MVVVTVLGPHGQPGFDGQSEIGWFFAYRGKGLTGLDIVDRSGSKILCRPVKQDDALPVIGSFQREKRHNDLK
jgi:hypothetical protein